jgi:hypothetical protein
MNKVFTFFAFLVCLSLPAFADRAMPGIWQVMKLADGTEVRVELKGDEHVHFWQTAEGLRYLERGGVLRLTNAREIDSIAYAKRALVYGDNRVAQSRRNFANSRKAEFKGKKKGLIILVEFSNKVFAMQEPQKYFARMANEEGFSEG